jgi:ATP-dependent Clp protease ATP-binding subunit ClpC
MIGLPSFLVGFIKWWFIETPKRLFVIGRRLIILVNSQISFTLNAKLLFVPLFGDYSIAGRLIGFLVRIFEIIVGLIFICTLSLAFISLPILWLVTPLILFEYLNILILPLYYGLYTLFRYLIREVPAFKIQQLNNSQDLNVTLQAFRPEAKNAFYYLTSNFNSNIELVCSNQKLQQLIKNVEIDPTNLVTKLKESPNFDTRLIVATAVNYALTQNTRYIEIEHVLLGALANVPRQELVLSSFGSSLKLFEGAASWQVERREMVEKSSLFHDDYQILGTGGFGKGMTGHVTPFLDSMSTDFTKEATQGGYERYTVRETAVKKLSEMLSGSNQNILIIGDPGSGKTSLVKGAAYKILEGNEYKSISNKRIVSIEISGIIAGAGNAGMLAEKINKAFAEAKHSRDIILFIDEIHNLVASAGDKSAESAVAYSILEPQLASGNIQFIGATSKQNYRKYIEPNGAFSRLFNVLELEPASKEETLEILKYDVANLEKKKRISVTYPALDKIIDLSQKLIHERVLPDKAILILDRAASDVESTTKLINTKVVEKTIAEMTHIPVETVSEDEAKRLLKIEDEMKEMVIGQDFAIKQVGSALKRARAGIRNESKPIASFLFVGTTGVGKTQTAKALAKCYFGDAKNMIRLDMSEYQQLDSIDRLIGSPDGSTKGVLTENVRSRPFALLLLDEIEKAHPNILLTFLQVLDEGRLTDSSGLVIDFTNTIIIATSNAGTRAIQQSFAENKSEDEMKEVALVEVRSKFAPEFLNRFNGIIVFNPLNKENVTKIARLLLTSVQKNADSRGVKLTFTEELIQKITDKGYNPEWGARPMARVIEDNVESYIAERLLSGELKQGDEREIGVEVFEG